MRKANLWNSLSEEQKQEVLLAFEESEDESKLIDGEAVLALATLKESTIKEPCHPMFVYRHESTRRVT